MKRTVATFRIAAVDIQNGTLKAIVSLCLAVISRFGIVRGGVHEIDGKWDLLIAHPPCTELCSSGQRWYAEKKKNIKLQREAIAFFYKFVLADCDRIAIENPVGIMSTAFRKPDQIINPWQFGHKEQKKTCLWLKNLPLLEATENVYSEMMKLPEKERCRIWYMGSNHGKERSKTFPGIAKAMAEQWTAYIESTRTDT